MSASQGPNGTRLAERQQSRLFTYSENLALGELSLLDEYTELRHILVQPLGELVTGQRGAIALECLAQGRYQVRGFICGFCLRLRLGRGHGEHDEGTTDAGCGRLSGRPQDSHVCCVSDF